MQRRTRRSASTIGGAAPDTIIGPAAADRAGARPYRATRCENASRCASPDHAGARPLASRDPTRHRAGSNREARNLLNRQPLFEICVSIPSLTKSLSGALEQFQHNNLVKNEKRQFVKAPHWQDRSGLALGIVCHRLRG
jgi:hypothetical protein